MPCYNTAAHKRSQRVLRRPCSYTANAAKQRTGLYRRFSCDLPHSTAANNRPTQAAIIPPAGRWNSYARPDALHRYQIPAQRWTLHSLAQPPYYNKVYKGAAHRKPCQPGGLQSGTLHPAGKSSGGGAAGDAEPLAACAASLFGLSPDS